MSDGVTLLRAYLDRRGITQTAFAAEAGVPAPQMSMWMLGRRRPGLGSAVKIERATGGAVKAADWLMGSSGQGDARLSVKAHGQSPSRRSRGRKVKRVSA